MGRKHKQTVQVLTLPLSPTEERKLLDSKLFLRVDEAAAILCISKDKVYRLIRGGKLDPTDETPIRVTTKSVKEHIRRDLNVDI